MLNQLRKAGEGLRKMDDAYSGKIASMYQGANPAVQAAAYMVGGAHPSLRKAEPEGATGIAKAAMEYGIPAANAVPKYILPVTGAGLALKGLSDVFGGQADQPEPNTLTIP